METPGYEAEGAVAEVAAGAAFVLVVGLVLWPPRNVYWGGVADVVGEGVALALVVAAAVGLGAWYGRISPVALGHLAVGGLLAYLAGMAAIEVALAPDSPVHLLSYGALVAALFAGSLLWRAIERLGRRA